MSVRTEELFGLLNFDQARWDDALKNFSLVLIQEPWNGQAHYKSAQILQELHRGPEADRHFRRNEEINRLSSRILELQSESLTGFEEIQRLNQLATAYEGLGQAQIAAQLRRQAEYLEAKPLGQN
ncbi:MAG: hypothetical protein R3C49_23080 [Planctomycetaceae bacterium]